ncbi:class I SAM-dependent methyltransferase [Leptolyngbyaceae cyanobacterium CCMR0082]|uniref:Class I SAM-dependent methyltransferase n=1 Tax=Adonisia turfae CCMR0082 TaxID=2304604 RepID=A0A6M0SE89_9CYAN|nr:class I SAM-dependent methyltransferase [Adonisia turfae]NEZ66820.1 class I SAM-dependent methyltransferase [Adonisia turfae CCMR0082]
MDYFLQIYGTLPRAGPGSNELTRRAFEMMSDLPESAKILDVGCGPGMQTVELLRITSGTVVALDLLPEMIAQVKARAENAGVSDRLETLEQSMTEMAFPESSFDVVWFEGSIYFLGFETGLKKVKNFLKPGGYVAVSEVVWLKSTPPTEAVEFWKEYPEIDTVAAKLDVIKRIGYESVGHFVLPATAWTEHYYNPMEERIAEKTAEWSGIPEAEAVLEEARNEISTFRKYSDYFSYAFFVMRN